MIWHTETRPRLPEPHEVHNGPRMLRIPIVAGRQPGSADAWGRVRELELRRTCIVEEWFPLEEEAWRVYAAGSRSEPFA